jgi:hypothetical protein
VHNSTYPKGGVSCSKDSFVVNQKLVFQIKFCGKSPALRVAAKRYLQTFPTVVFHVSPAPHFNIFIDSTLFPTIAGNCYAAALRQAQDDTLMYKTFLLLVAQ